MTGEAAPSPRAFATRPLLCPRCQGPVPLGDGAWAVCPYCRNNVPIPASYQTLRAAARQESEDLAEAEKLYERLGKPPGALLGAWAVVARALGSWVSSLLGLFARTLAWTWPLAIVLILPLAVFGHMAAPWLGIDPVSRLGAPAFYVFSFLAFMLVVALPAALAATADERASVRLALQRMLASAPPATQGGVSRCRRCGAPLTVRAGALGARCDYCGTDNLVQLPASWLRTQTRAVVEDHDAITSAIAAERTVHGRGIRRLQVTTAALFVCTPLMAVAGWFAEPDAPSWADSRNPPRAMLWIDHPDQPLLAGTAMKLECGEDDGPCAWHFAMALDSGERLTLEATNAAPTDEVTILDHSRSFRPGANGDSEVAFVAPYTGLFDIDVDIREQLPRECSFMWALGASPPALRGLPRTDKWRQELSGRAIQDVAFSPDGKRLAVAAMDRGVIIVDAATGARISTLGAHTSATSVAWTPDGSALAAGSVDKLVRVYDAGTGRTLQDNLTHDGVVTAVAYSPDGRFLASGSNDGAVQIWDVQHDYERAGHDDDLQDVLGLAFDSSELAVGTDSGADVLMAPAGARISRLKWKYAGDSVAYDSDGRILVGDAAGGLVDWSGFPTDCVSPETAYRCPTRRLGQCARAISDLAVARRAALVASASVDGTLTLWPLSGEGTPLTLSRAPVGFHSVAFSSDERRLAAGLDNGRVMVWSLAPGESWIPRRARSPG